MTYEEVLEQAQQLSPIEKARLMGDLSAALQQDLSTPETPQPKQSLFGVFADLGEAPSAEEIDEVRREMWNNFPREDI